MNWFSLRTPNVVSSLFFLRSSLFAFLWQVLVNQHGFLDVPYGEDGKGTEEHLTIPKGVEVYEINGPYFFGAGNRFEEIMATLGDRPQVRIIRMRKVPFVDSTGIHNLTNLCEMSQKEGIQIVLSGVTEKVHSQHRKP